MCDNHTIALTSWILNELKCVNVRRTTFDVVLDSAVSLIPSQTHVALPTGMVTKRLWNFIA
jgi:hypothetical protein